ncbi:MAG: hypothetical protein KGJ62_06080 [Armatimonadetes bacterium]|nr:hypothetical protein [Armatimonadota bacterium]MDE2205918.1 hypothetical protein [Armatimonadota bacterium]
MRRFLARNAILVVAACLLAGLSDGALGSGRLLLLAAVFALGGAAGALALLLVIWWTRHTQKRAERRCSDLVSELTPQLLGDYGPFVIDAASRLGMANDPTAVPVLMRALDQYVEAQRPGWRDVAEEIVQALGKLGDRRALPLLRRLETVRGIGFIGALRAAIASIEPQTSLLRPGVHAVHTLLRPSRSALERADRDELVRPTAELEAGATAALSQAPLL